MPFLTVYYWGTPHAHCESNEHLFIFSFEGIFPPTPGLNFSAVTFGENALQPLVSSPKSDSSAVSQKKVPRGIVGCREIGVGLAVCVQIFFVGTSMDEMSCNIMHHG